MGFNRTPTGLQETVLGPLEEDRIGDLKVLGGFVGGKVGFQE